VIITEWVFLVVGGIWEYRGDGFTCQRTKKWI
jgi:hypothetical protein